MGENSPDLIFAAIRSNSMVVLDDIFLTYFAFQKMIELNLPIFDFKLKNQGQKKYIFDLVKKKFVTLTPEEWVRQHWIHFLVEYQSIPLSFLAIESAIKVNNMHRRADIVAYKKDLIPGLVVECKAPHIPINEDVVWQAAAYNQKIKAQFLVVSNGINHKLYRVDFEKNILCPLDKLPIFSEW
jgi:hypothetical protein